MATELPIDPGDNKASYSDRVKSNVKFDKRLKRNILGISIEKADIEIAIDIDHEDVARICQTLGIQISSEVEGYNIHYYGRKAILYVWMVAGINLEKYCKDKSIRVRDGLGIGMIRPSGKKEVTVTVTGVDFNTPDSLVIEYLNKFGNVVSDRIVYSKFDSGPFIGKFNGER